MTNFKCQNFDSDVEASMILQISFASKNSEATSVEVWRRHSWQFVYITGLTEGVDFVRLVLAVTLLVNSVIATIAVFVRRFAKLWAAIFNGPLKTDLVWWG
jgi:hypothetical protein